jgi:hypothetical protein
MNVDYCVLNTAVYHILTSRGATPCAE